MGIFDPKHHLAFMVIRRLRGPLNLMFRWREREKERLERGSPPPTPIWEAHVLLVGCLGEMRGGVSLQNGSLSERVMEHDHDLSQRPSGPPQHHTTPHCLKFHKASLPTTNTLDLYDYSQHVQVNIRLAIKGTDTDCSV